MTKQSTHERGVPAAQPRRAVRGRALVLAAGLVAVIAAAAGLLASSSEAAPSRLSFPHRPHMTAEQVEAGQREAEAALSGAPRPGGGGVVDKDCRSCHDYENVGPEHHLDRAKSCDQCHLGSDFLEFETKSAVSQGRRMFPHKQHLSDPSITCFTCHRMTVDRGWVEFAMPVDGLGPRGTQGRPGGALGDYTCADCHSEHVPAGEKAGGAYGEKLKQDDLTGDGKKCSDCHLNPGGILPLAYRTGQRNLKPRPFLHADHGGSQGECDACHASINDSKTAWDYDPTQGTEQACKACHTKDAAGTPLVGLGRTSVVPNVDFSMFPHDKHLKPPGNLTTIGEQNPNCNTCHFPDATTREPVGREQLVDYNDCITCHDSWKLGDHGGSAGGWGCFKCHGGTVDENGMLEMAEVSVDRDHVDDVRFTKHHHPGITESGNELSDKTQEGGKTCLDCHVQGMDELASRIQGKPFGHDPHLPVNPRTEDCLACHSSIATARYSEDTKRFDPHIAGLPSPVGAAATAKGCLECHVGATAADLGLSKKGRKVPQFDHRVHLQSKWKSIQKGISCSECHVPGGPTGYSTPEDVANCKSCHSHDKAKYPEKEKRTGPADTGDVDEKSCNVCHGAEHGANPTQPGPGSRSEASRTRRHLTLLDGVQWHDKSGGCNECHDRDPKADGSRWEYTHRVAKTRALASIHDDPRHRDAWFNQASIEKTPDSQGRTCKDCHRSDPDGYLKSLSNR